MGSSDKMLEFYSKIWKVLNQTSYSRDHWADQCAVNYLIYYQKLFHNESIIRSANKDGLILTLGIARPQNFMIDSDGNILNGKGEMAAVIHQYDRNKNITRNVFKKYNYYSNEENKYKNYNKIIQSNSYLNKNQIIKNYINLSLTNISNNNITIPKENDNFYLKENINKNIKIKNYILIFLILITLLTILFIVSGKIKKQKFLKYKYKKNKINIHEKKSGENSRLIYVLDDED